MNDRDESPDQAPRESPAAARIRHQARWVELQLQQAIARGEFDDLPGAGKPLPELDDDPDWWVKRLIDREHITGVLPEALQLRKDNGELETLLDKQSSETSVREELESFNRRIINARRQLQGGPPVITPLRDVDQELEAWRARRAGRRA